jgi:hypothetical protein
MRLPSTSSSSNLLPPLPNYNTNTNNQRGKGSSNHYPGTSPLGNLPRDPLCCERLAAPQNSATQFQVRPVRAGIDGLLMLILRFGFRIRVPVMDKVIDAFNLLALELPDPEQELSPQNLGRKLETFTCFPKLPPELRRIIWKLTFPNRRLIDLTLVRLYRGRPIYGRGADPKHPIALHVNRESRAIALQIYHGIFQMRPLPIYEHKNKTKPGIRSLFFDPKVDQFCMDSYDILNWVDSKIILAAFLVETDLKCFGLIKSVEIRNFSWHFGLNGGGWPTPERLETGMLEYFRGLEELHLVAGIDFDLFGEDSVLDSAACYSTLHNYFERKARLDPERPPSTRFYLHDYRRRTTRCDIDHILHELIEWPFFEGVDDDE